MKVFVYGSLKSNQSNHSVIEGAKYCGVSEVPCMIMYDLDAFPMIVESSDPADVVQIEIYNINVFLLRKLDRLEGYPNFYKRKVVWALNGIKGWIYYGDQHQVRSRNRIKNGIWK